MNTKKLRPGDTQLLLLVTFNAAYLDESCSCFPLPDKHYMIEIKAGKDISCMLAHSPGVYSTQDFLKLILTVQNSIWISSVSGKASNT